MQFKAVAAINHVVSPLNQSGSSNMRVKTGAHSVYDLRIHLVFVTKYRRNVLSVLSITDFRRTFTDVCANFEATLIECDGEGDHVHLLIHYPQKLALSKLINHLKGVSSRYIRNNRPEVSGSYRKAVLWSPSYFAGSCGGVPLSIIADYVKNHRGTPLSPHPKGRGIRGEIR